MAFKDVTKPSVKVALSILEATINGDLLLFNTPLHLLKHCDVSDKSSLNMDPISFSCILISAIPDSSEPAKSAISTVRRPWSERRYELWDAHSTRSV